MNEKLNRLKLKAPQIIEEMKTAGYDAKLIEEAQKELADEIELWELYGECDFAWKAMKDSYFLWFGFPYHSNQDIWILTPRNDSFLHFAKERIGEKWHELELEDGRISFISIGSQKSPKMLKTVKNLRTNWCGNKISQQGSLHAMT